MKVTLQENGRNTPAKPQQIAEKPAEGKWFKVNPLAIDKNLFKEKRSDPRQEATRQLILQAFVEMKKDLVYTKPFMTMMPEKKWVCKPLYELSNLPIQWGYFNADWVEQSLEWAQRITNGETWEAICNQVDSANWYRLVGYNDDLFWLVGGSCKDSDNKPPANVRICSFCSEGKGRLYNKVVPLVVLYE